MNLLLLEPGELAADGTARLSGRRALHLREVLRAQPGDALRAGVLGGRWGEARVLRLEGEAVLAVSLDRDPPPPSPVELLLALPRPKVLRRVVQAVAAMGVKRLVLCGSWRVEKAYWSSPALDPAALREDLLLGLEQGRDTILPEVTARRLFKPLVEDELAALLPAPARLLAHPAPGAAPLEAVPPAGGRAALAVGPEGGFTPYEAGLLLRHGFRAFSLGPRILRVDAAVAYAVGQVELALRAAPAGPA